MFFPFCQISKFVKPAQKPDQCYHSLLVGYAERRMEDSLLAADDAGYKAAKRDREDAAAGVEMHEKRLSMLDAIAMASGEDYAALEAKLKNEYNAICRDAAEKMADLADQMEAIGQEQLKAYNTYSSVYIPFGVYLSAYCTKSPQRARERRKGFSSIFFFRLLYSTSKRIRLNSPVS